ncbi:hypothetical protein VaNZ11_010631 [Volvox africanus]|uniref:Uncharacterized protein n=1 Tax=Volvox africanus TaxID=51714 RepID=A0ABQ5SBX8_9CHLO|nr:hypothetical protein VaNZ11_010631 [Volvox africanus]
MQCRCRSTPLRMTWVMKSYNKHCLAAVRASPTRFHIPGREARGISVPVAASQPQNIFLASDNNRENPNHLGPNGPKLLPRPIRPKSDGGPGSGKGSGGGGGGSGGGGGQPAGFGERTLASLAAYTGLVGTTALVLGKLVGVDLWAEFDWASLDDLRMAVEVSIPLQLLNAALLLPSYSSPKQLPDFGNLKTLEANLKSERERQEKQKTLAPPASPPSLSGTAVDDAAGAIAAAVRTSTAEPPAAAAASTISPMVPAGLWGRSREDGGLKDNQTGEDGWTSLRSALHLAQGNYISNNPTARLTPAAEAAFTFMDTAASEMLYRGVALTWLTSWLQDRVYEAGMDEMLTYELPAAASTLGLPSARDVLATLGVYGACECAVAVGVAAFVAWLAAARSRRAIQRLEMFMKSSAAASSTARRSGGSAADTDTDTGTGTGAKASGGGEGSGGAARAAAQVLFGPGGPSVGISGAAAVMQRAAAVQGSRDAIQVLLLNGIFIVSGGNLAASYTASVINQLLFSVMQRRGVNRMRERSAALARELKAYNAQMQRIANKYKDKLPPAVVSRLDRITEEEAVAEASAPSSSTAAVTIIKDDTTTGNSTGNSKASSSSSSSSSTASTTSTTSTTSSNGCLEVYGSSTQSTATSSSPSSALPDDINGNVGSSSNKSSSSSIVSSSSIDDSGSSDTSSDSVVSTIARHLTPNAAGSADVLGTPNGTNSIDIDSNGSNSLVRVLTVLDMLVPEPPKPVAADRKPRQQQQQRQQ